jgi:hypothetical protein
MLKLPLIEFFLRLIPEAAIFVLAVHVYTKTKLDKNKYIMSLIVYSIIGYLVRFLPIDYGIHSVLNLIVLVILSVKLNRIKIIKAIQSVIAIFLTMFISEGINVAIIQFVLKKDINAIFSNSTTKLLYGSPSLLISAVVVGVYYLKTSTKKNKSNQINKSYT